MSGEVRGACDNRYLTVVITSVVPVNSRGQPLVHQDGLPIFGPQFPLRQIEGREVRGADDGPRKLGVGVIFALSWVVKKVTTKHVLIPLAQPHIHYQ